jgi:flagellin-like hook-associated protein FlgL
VGIAVAVTVNLLPGSINLEEGATGSYKPGPQAWFLVSRMEQLEKSLLNSIAKLIEQLHSMDQKVDKFSGELGAVQTKVDLAMSSISLVQQGQV